MQNNNSNTLVNTEMLNAFFQEALESIESIEKDLLDLADNPADQNLIDETFRLMHSLKGNAGFMEQVAVEKLAHAMEDILSVLRTSRLAIEDRTNQLLIEATDSLKGLIIQEITGDNPEIADVLNSLVEELNLLGISCDTTTEVPAKTDIPDDFFGSCEAPIQNNQAVESLNLLTEFQKLLFQFEQAEKPANSRLTDFVVAFKNIQSDLKSPTISELTGKLILITEFYSKTSSAIPESILYLLTDLSDLLDGCLLNLQAGNSPEINGLAELLNSIQSEVKQISPQLALELAKPQITEKHGDQIPNSTVADKNETTPTALENHKAAANSNIFGSFRQTDIRVNLEKLDLLLDLTGELVIAGSLITNSRQKGVDELEKAVDSLNRIIRDLQETTMTMRLLPFSLLFARMQKLVYSLAKKANKKVKLIMVGESTEVDKSLLEAVGDPLLHLLRNAVDHGLESAEERAKTEKPLEGTIRLEASVAGSEIQLLISDDGRGLNVDKIHQKALELKLISADANLSEDETINLIFLPGFSTAEKVTEVSGRGVGMDVVSKNIEKIKGKIKIKTKPGEGTEIKITIPLTLTIMEGLLVRTGQSRYIIPLDNIIETFVTNSEELTVMPDKGEFVRKRNTFYRIIRLHKLHNIANTDENLQNGVLILVKSSENEAMLFVEEIIGQETTVIKSLPDYLGNLKTISGCAILGNGEVCQILHIPAILDLEIASKLNE